MSAVLSLTSPSNELMRGCLLRWQSERKASEFRPHWSVVSAFSFNPRFLIVLSSHCQQKKYGLA